MRIRPETAGSRGIASYSSKPSRNGRRDPNHDSFRAERNVGCRSASAAQYLPFEIRPELGTEVPGQIEPELERTLRESEGHRVEPARIPLVRKIGRSVGAAEAPNGQRLSSPVRTRENGAAERMSRAAPEPAAGGTEIAGILVQG